jgi:hypothetical protein
MLEQIAGALDLKQDTLIVLSDHGQIDRGGHGGQDPITLVEPFVMVGAGVKPGQYLDMQMVDVAPTIAVLLGTNIPASTEGRPLMETLNVDGARQTLIHKAWSAQQAALAFAYESAIGAPTQSRESAQAAIDAARESRKSKEELPRLVVTGVIVFVVSLGGAGQLAWTRRRDAERLVVAAILYVVLYNFIFAVIAGNTYSMSTVPTSGATAFVIEIAEYTLIATLPAWLIVMLITGAFKRGATDSAQATFAFGFVTICFLYLPALWGFAINGAWVTWHLPDPLTIFLHFTNLLQAMLVAVLSIVLAGVAALLGWRLKVRA